MSAEPITLELSVPKRPDWVRVRAPGGKNHDRLLGLVTDLNLHTVCQSARCPNMGECWEKGTATFMILGDICTRACGFCAVKTGRPTELDLEEPYRVAEAIQALSLRHCTITSVNRDELKDGGALIFARTIEEVRKLNPHTTIEVLTPDFRGDVDALKLVIDQKPHIYNHNMETIARLHKRVRPQAKYERSLEVLRKAKELNPGQITKTGVMLGLGETAEEVIDLMGDVTDADVDIFTIGQYLRPSFKHLPVEKYYHPEEFEILKEEGERMGLRHVESGPLVRSSYHAREQFDELHFAAE
ncbi:MAG: lipoyl synthase [Armatimonadetes bacterium]|nr:lipoyl synthase [Armatimonadota bacterium]